MTEEWRDIPGYGGHYQVSDFGRVRTKDRTVIKKHSMTGRPTSMLYKARILKPSPDGDGHLKIHIGVDGQRFHLFVHRLVLLVFVGPCPQGMECCHGNGVASDNWLSNLRWDTHAANNSDRLKHGTYKRGEANHYAKLTDAQVRSVRSRGLSTTAISKELNTSLSNASRISRGVTWRHVLLDEITEAIGVPA